VTVEEAGLMGCCAVWVGNFFRKFPRKVPPFSSGLLANSRTHNPEDEGVNFFRNVGKQLPNHTA
jgi:hypothetical protein